MAKKELAQIKLQIPAGAASPTPPAAVLLKRAAKIAKGSGEPNREKVGTVTSSQVREIAETKRPDLNAHDIDMAMRIVAGTARSMGIDVVDG